MDLRRHLDEPETDMTKVVRPAKGFAEAGSVLPRIPFDDDDFGEQAIPVGQFDQRIEVPLSTSEQSSAVVRIVNREHEADLRTIRDGREHQGCSVPQLGRCP